MGQKQVKLDNVNNNNDAEKIHNQKVEMDENFTNNLPNNINEVSTTESTQVKSKRLRQFIIKNIVQPTFVADLVDTLKWRYRWRKIGNFLYILSKLLTLVGAIVAFTETYFKVIYLALASGIITLLGVLILQLGDYAQKESKRKTNETNEILRMLDISGVPELDDPVKETKTMNTEIKPDKQNETNNNKQNNDSNDPVKPSEITETIVPIDNNDNKKIEL
ncbi:hypothetical protein Catovirus_1_847 [Catovirus CTV1]|uniref:Uncharacterized protein n=1 Tax=Catovirus CTV1 TaxID=1977631 RepID=A0A1V0SAQ7_9VIRU|nr:hypothetical protein Catovirus_1_847 [Catovirus CTV1]